MLFELIDKENKGVLDIEDFEAKLSEFGLKIKKKHSLVKYDFKDTTFTYFIKEFNLFISNNLRFKTFEDFL